MGYFRLMVDKDLTAWLNNPDNYHQGFNILHRLRPAHTLLTQIIKSPTKQHREELFQALRTVYYEQKQIRIKQPVPNSHKGSPSPENTTSTKTTAPDHSASPIAIAAKQEADKAYKVMASIRHNLFYLCTVEPEQNENDFDLVTIRKGTVLKLLEQQSLVDQLYEKYEYACKHGYLPTLPEPKSVIPTNPIELERARLNTIKCIRRLSHQEQTPERVQLIETHKENLQKITDAIAEYIK
jgi:hypothetical protein